MSSIPARRSGGAAGLRRAAAGRYHLLVTRSIAPILLSLLLATGCVPTGTTPDPPSGGNQPSNARVFGLYDDTAEADGSAWPEGLDFIEAALGAGGSTVVRLDQTKLNTDPEALADLDGLIFGGGFAYPGYTMGISAEGKQRIRDFVEGGGTYVGVCAGAYFACDELLYEGEVIGDESGYDLDLYEGPCMGPVGAIAHFPDWGIAQIEFPGHPSYADFGHPFTQEIWYGGGPFFPGVEAGTTVLATYADPGIQQEGDAAVVARHVGDGDVLLWGPHPEVTDEGATASNPDLFAEMLRWFVK